MLLDQQFEGSFDLLAIDSGSTDGTLELARNSPGVRTVQITPAEFHHGRTRNLGAELTTGWAIVFITQDALPVDRAWLRTLIAPLHDPSVAMVVGRQIAWEDTKPPEKFFYMYSFPESRITVRKNVPAVKDSIFISDVNSAIRRDVWQRLRFSEIVLQAEDKEIAKRIVASGGTIIYEPAAAVYHAHDFTLGELIRRAGDAGISLAQGVGMPRSRRWVLHKLRYYMLEARYIMGCQKWYKWLPYSVAYESARLLGTMAGWTAQETSRIGRP